MDLVVVLLGMYTPYVAALVWPSLTLVSWYTGDAYLQALTVPVSLELLADACDVKQLEWQLHLSLLTSDV